MKLKLFLAGLSIVVTLSALAATNDLTSTLQRGLFEEEANQNLDAAVQAYQAVSAQFDKDRKLAATAIFRLGEVYRKQGKTNEATAQYERIVREFSDQQTLVTMSQQNLAGMNGSRANATGVSAPMQPGASNAWTEQYNRRRALLEQLKKLKPEELRLLLPRVTNDPVLQETLKQLNAQEVKMAGIKKDFAPDHPEYLRAQAELDATQQQFKEICESALKSLQIEVDSLKEAIDAQKPRGTTAPQRLTADEEELARSEKILAQLKGWDLPQLRKLIPTLAPDAEFDRLNEQLRLNEAYGDSPDNKAVLDQRENYRKRLQDRTEVIIVTLEKRVADLKERIAKEIPNSRVARDSEPSTTDEEEKEIQHIKLMVQNSPDLINAPESGRGGYTPLAAAASAGWLRVAKYLLDNGAAINRPSNGSTPLHMAATQGHKAMVELLADRGADLEAHDSTGATPLHLAAENGFLSVAEMLVQHKADLNSRNSKSNGEQTPLHRAVEKGHPAIVAFLISKGANVNARDSKGMSPLFRAARAGYAEVFTKLLASGANQELEDNEGRTVLSHTSERGQTNFMTLLLAAKANPNGGKIDLPLAAAARGQRLDAARILLSAGADPQLPGKSTTTVQAPGVNYGQPGTVFGPYLPLQIAVSKNDTAMVKLLLSFKADANTPAPWITPTVLLVAYTLDNPEMLKAFLDAGADANTERSSGTPAISLAAGNGFSEAVELLLAHGAKPDVRSSDGRTPISRAAERNCLKCVQSLISAKATVDAADPNGVTALDWATAVGNQEMVEALLAAGANVNQKDQNGNTPLHFAARLRTPAEVPAMMQLLLSKGADPNVRNNERNTPLDIAKSQPTFAPGTPSIPAPYSVSLPGGVAPQDARAKIFETLHKGGALDELPDLDTISITRGTMKPITLMNRDAAGNNRFTLFEALNNYYSRTVSTSGARLPTNPEWQTTRFYKASDRALAFPDFTAIRILRQAGAKATDRKEIIVNAMDATNAFDCAKDVPLEFGDVIEIREREYTLAESSQQIGLTLQQRATLDACTARQVTFAVRGEKVQVALPGNDANLSSAILHPKVQNLLRSTSNLAQTKVQRVDTQTGKQMEITVDAQPKTTNDRLWLKDGDLIEVPDKL